MKKDFFAKNKTVIILALVIVFIFFLASFPLKEPHTPENEIIISADDFDLSIDSSLADTITEQGHNSLVVFRDKVKT